MYHQKRLKRKEILKFLPRFVEGIPTWRELGYPDMDNLEEFMRSVHTYYYLQHIL